MPCASLHSECYTRPWVRIIHNVWVVTERACDHQFDGGAAHFEGYDPTVGSRLRPTSLRLLIVGGVRRRGRRTVACRRAVSPIQGYGARASDIRGARSWRDIVMCTTRLPSTLQRTADCSRRRMASPEQVVAQRCQIDMSRGNASQDSADNPPHETEKASEQRGAEAQPHPDNADH